MLDCHSLEPAFHAQTSKRTGQFAFANAIEDSYLLLILLLNPLLLMKTMTRTMLRMSERTKLPTSITCSPPLTHAEEVIVAADGS